LIAFWYSPGEYQKAINDYDQAIALNPKDAMAFGNRGVTYANLGEA
jgi:tetratricopeptide (TPR) repeat protein